ncbi:sigma-70 family RNA polymerase sigma factor [Clostridium sp. YIM B02505]|uniref:Sigma-70 family RNA polymerase sigma factor n=1 Tax=Clostridium yunnanense TaxID=2800325 RepID=A0ABS1ET83_9CLOT|nr:sigma-70 family RNA polymerase sigma factor [Clostridium yunnanense]MBK1812588.1 sigma-70 family RNA polymerase sigma factor [Clostridium yunnanense]
MKITSENFIPQLIKKNPSALDYVIDNYSNLMFKVITSVLGADHREDCMECLNDVILKIWNNISSYKSEESKFTSWLIAVSKYNAIDYKRKLLKTKNQCDIDDITLINEKSTEDIILDNENRSELLNIINTLEYPDREIFIRRYLIGDSINTICSSLNLTRSSVDNRIFRGKKKLKEQLTSVYGGVVNE